MVSKNSSGFAIW